MRSEHTHAGLRAWAKGIYPLEAGVELLLRAAGGVGSPARAGHGSGRALSKDHGGWTRGG